MPGITEAELGGRAEAERQEREKAFQHQERMPADVEDAIAILSERGHGSAESLRRYVAGEPGSGSNLPPTERLSSRNEFAALNLLVCARKPAEPVPVKEPVYNLPDPANPDLTMLDLVKRGPLFVSQFRDKHPEAFARLEVAERRRLAGPPVR